MSKDAKIFILLTASFLAFYFLPVESALFTGALLSGLALLNEYAREHVLTCLVPAFFIAGAIAVFIRRDAVLKYLGPQTRRLISYSLASVSGAILAVCSCTILPIFAGIRQRGAGLGPAITFLFSGPAINVAAIFLTISVLGLNIGLARITAAVGLSIIVGLTMQAIFREQPGSGEFFVSETKEADYRPAAVVFLMTALVAILVVNGLALAPALKYAFMLVLAALAAGIAMYGFSRDTRRAWLSETWNFSKMLIPILFAGVFVAGFVMPFLPEALIQRLVGDNSVAGNLAAAVFGAFMYFSTLTEVPILQALIAKGMSPGPALALLLAGPSLSLPNMLVVRKVLGNKKTAVYVCLVIGYSTLAGWFYGAIS